MKAVKKAAKKVAAKTSPAKVQQEKLMALPKTLKIPANLAQAADLLYVVKKNRLAAQNALKPLVEFESELREHIINTLPKSKAGGIAGKIARATIEKKEVPVIEDERTFFKYAQRKGNEDLLTTKPDMKAVEQRWENNKAVPGVGKFTVVTLGLNKV